MVLSVWKTSQKVNMLTLYILSIIFGLIFLVECGPSFVILAHIVKLVSHNGRKIERVKQKFTKVSSVENF